MSNVITKWVEAQKLPPGHIGKRQAEEALAKIYGKCQTIESTWRKRIGNKVSSFKTEKDILQFCNKLCDMVGSFRIKSVTRNCTNVPPGAEADYLNGEIRFASNYVGMISLVHELTHHVERQARGHGELFCWTENFIFGLAYKLITGKKPKPDWIN